MIDFGQQIADAEREFKHGNPTVAFGRLASVCAHMLGRIEALEAEVERSRADTQPRDAPTVDNHLHLFDLDGLCTFPGCPRRKSTTESADHYADMAAQRGEGYE